LYFNSVEYPFFLLAVLFGFWALARVRWARHVMLLAASYLFYGCWNPWYLALIVLLTLVHWGVALGLERTGPRGRKTLMAAGAVFSLGVLGLFKYFNFFVDNANTLLAAAGLEQFMPHVRLLLPVGISFYTFQAMSYSIDVYRGELKALRNPVDFALFVAFFPQLVAGPILRASQFMPQLARDPAYDDRRAASGLFRILVGLVKKVVVADTLGVLLVDKVFGTAPGTQALAGAAPLEVLIAIYAYTFQIYCDFSGYSDIAIGTGRLMGFEIPENFDRPYAAVNLRDFWRRWHISLSTWLRDYLYIPLGGSQRGAGRTYAALAATMLLGGLWHGASWNFVIWGAFHGILLALTRWWQRRNEVRGRMPTDSPFVYYLKRLGTFHLVCLGWVFFRALTLQDALTALGRLFAWGEDTHFHVPGAVSAVLVLAIAVHMTPKVWLIRAGAWFVLRPAWVQAAATVAVIWLASLMAQAAAPFIYFQF
jgi:D-alanyl-lipoteichoic acid acyltransferase DltB (MBOAT superfamily)